MQKVYLFIAILFFSFCTQSLETENLNSTPQTTLLEIIDGDENIKIDETVESELNISENFDRYFDGIVVSEGPDFDVQIVSDIDVINDNLMFITALHEGKIFKYDVSNDKTELFLDLSVKTVDTIDKNNEMGLLSIEFHPSYEYFLVAFVNKSMQLKVEQFFLDSETLMILDNNSLEILSIDYFDKVHFSGNLVYSDFYNGFIFSSGDGLNDELGLRADSIYSYVNRGKLLLLLPTKNNQFVNPVISYSQTENKNIILAYGIRNPWGIAVSEDKLFVPDVGRSRYEEVTVLELTSNRSYFLGYPLFEGPFRTDYKHNEIYHWSNELRNPIDEYLIENYQNPAIFYKHTEMENGFRCAVIGGAVLNNLENDYWNDNFTFIDYCSKELFFYNYMDDILIASSLEELKIDNFYVSKIAQFNKSNLIVLGFTYEVIDGEYIVNNKNFLLRLPSYPIFKNN